MADSVPHAIATGEIRWHVGFITELARVMRPRVYVELGVHTAELFNRVAPFAGQAIGVDMDPQAGTFIQPSSNIRFVCNKTNAFLAEVEDSGLNIDLLFIDADHCRESVLRDFRGYFPHVRPQGLILLHDSNPDPELIDPDWCGDGYLAVEELAATNDEYEMVTLPLSPGLTICRKRTQQLSWKEPSQGEVLPSQWGLTGAYGSVSDTSSRVGLLGALRRALSAMHF